jgi:hypothetical protein
MPAQPSGRSRHGELSLDQLAELQPGLGRLMPDVGRRYWILFYAARGGNWELAHYQWRQLRHLFQIGATTRPKMAVHLEAFMAGAMRPSRSRSTTRLGGLRQGIPGGLNSPTGSTR